MCKFARIILTLGIVVSCFDLGFDVIIWIPAKRRIGGQNSKGCTTE